eukprot:gene1756-525_t
MSSKLLKRIAKKSFHNKICSPEDTIKHFEHGTNMGWSGFAGIGYPKVIPTTLADYVEKNNLQKKLAFNLYVGASVGAEIEDRWAKLDMTMQRWPFISGKEMAKKINSGEINMGDAHLSSFAKGFEYGNYSKHKLHIGIIEATEITAEGGIVLSGGVGISPEVIQRAEKLIIEVNTALPSYYGMHDIIHCKKPPHRRPYLISRVDDRIGDYEVMDFDREKLVGIVESTKLDNGNDMAPLDEKSKKISDHIMDFFESSSRNGTMPKNLCPIQSGVGNIANAVIGGFKNTNFVLDSWTEVLQDGMLDLIDAGKLKYVSTTGIALSNEGFKRFYENFDFYKKKIILRPQEISNSGEIISRLGVISMNAALEADIYGHVNSTLVGGTKMVHGIGGSGDFFRNGSTSIAHFPSTRPSKTDPTGISTILPMVSHVDHTEHDVQILCTEQGLADLRNLPPKARAREIINKCAHPDYKELLLDYFNHSEKECIKAGAGHEPQTLTHVFKMFENLKKHGTMKLKSWDFE